MKIEDVNAVDFVKSEMEKGFTSMDFEFVSFALAYGDPKVEIHELVPTASSKNRGGNPRFVFVLIGEGPDWFTKMEALHVSYINGKCLVEPTALASKRKMVRSLIVDHDHVKRRGIRRPIDKRKENERNK